MSHERVEPGPMPFHLLKQITDDFSDERNIGRGGYGSVYMGMYEDGRKVAVKILHSRPGFDEKQFEIEFRNLKSLQHQNIVRLIGYCHETSGEFLQHNEKTVLASKMNMALCMDYMAKGSLDKHISEEHNGHNWHTRYKIVKGICSGLQYLHEELENPFYHLDLKPANILLDEEMVPKIGDFGLSRFFEDQQTQITSACVGTVGYIPPEYIDKKAISSKFDIYSLGAVITKLISGSEGYTKLYKMKPEDFINLVHVNWRTRLQKESMSDIESSLELVRTCTKIAVRCLEYDRHKRPTIGEIVDELNEIETIMQFPYALSIDGGSSTDQVSLCTSTGTETQSTDAQNKVSELMDASDKKTRIPEIKESETVKVKPGHLHFALKPNKFISCLLHLTNKTDKRVAFRCVPKAKGVYINDLQHLRGIFPPNRTRLFVVTIERQLEPLSDQDLLIVMVESCVLVNQNLYGGTVNNYFADARKQSGGNIHGITLKCEYVTEDEVPTSKRSEPIVKMLYWNAGLGKVFSSDMHPTEPWILIGYSNGSIAIWNYKTHERVTALKITKEDKEPGPLSFLRRKEKRKLQAFSAKFIARKQWLAAGDGFGYIHVHTYESMQTSSRSGVMSMDKVDQFYAHTGAVTSLAVHPNEPFVLSASADRQIKLWDWENGWTSIRIFKRHKRRVSQVIFNPRNSSTFASVSIDGIIMIWDISSTIPITKMDCNTPYGHAVDYFSTSDACQFLVAACETGTLKILDLQAEEFVRSLSNKVQGFDFEEFVRSLSKLQGFDMPFEDHSVCCVAVVDSIPGSPMIAAVSEDNGIFLYDYMTRSYKRTYYFEHGRVHHIAYIKEINSVAVAFYQGLAIIEMPS